MYIIQVNQYVCNNLCQAAPDGGELSQRVYTCIANTVILHAW